MKSFASVLAAGFLLATGTTQPGGLRFAESLRFTPVAGRVLVKTIEGVLSLELVETRGEVIVNGEPQELGDFETEFEVRGQERAVLRDEWLSVDASGSWALERSYPELAEEVVYAFVAGVEKEQRRSVSRSELKGRRVRFARDADGAWEASFPEDEAGTQELLLDLEGDVDFLALLPPGPVEVGDVWPVDVGRWKTVERPGGDLKLLDEDNEEVSSYDEKRYFENLEGELQAEFLGVVDQDGVEVAHVRVSGDLESHIDDEPRSDAVGGLDPDASFQQDYRFRVKVLADLHWDREHGHARSLRVVSTLEMTHSTRTVTEFDSTKIESNSVQVFQGSRTTTVTLERED
jgi:hypothetical protein